MITFMVYIISSYSYMLEVEDYYRNREDSSKLEEIARIKHKWTIKKKN